MFEMENKPTPESGETEKTPMPESGDGNKTPGDAPYRQARLGEPSDGSGWITPPPDNWGWEEERPAREPGFEPAGGALPADEETEAPPRKRRGIARWLLRDLVVPLAVAFGVAMIFQATVAKPYQIPTGSMEPTIKENDRILADRLVYHFRSIHRGDVIVFNPPADLHQDTPFVKRVIGIPGDTVEIEHGEVLVNGQPFVVPSARKTDYRMAKETVPAGQLFVLGDNRDESYDSHRWGFVPIDNVIGRAEIVYWPLNHLQFLGN